MVRRLTSRIMKRNWYGQGKTLEMREAASSVCCFAMLNDVCVKQSELVRGQTCDEVSGKHELFILRESSTGVPRQWPKPTPSVWLPAEHIKDPFRYGNMSTASLPHSERCATLQY